MPRLTQRRRLTSFVTALFVTLGLLLAQPGTANAATWAACPADYDLDQTKQARNFTRAAGVQVVAGTSALRCGNSSYGYRHIADRHSRDWYNLALFTQYHNNWREMADLAISSTLAAPVSTSDVGNGKTQYNSWVYVRDTNGRLVKQAYTIVVVSRTNLNVITAYYTTVR